MTKAIAMLAMLSVPVLASPAFADTLPKLSPNEAIAVMPEGNVGRQIVTDAKTLAVLMEGAKPIPWCAMLLMGEDGKVYMVDTRSHSPMVACEEMVP
jgi:hypothetical protein